MLIRKRLDTIIDELKGSKQKKRLKANNRGCACSKHSCESVLQRKAKKYPAFAFFSLLNQENLLKEQ